MQLWSDAKVLFPRILKRMMKPHHVLLTSAETWAREAKLTFKPEINCVRCETIVTSTTILNYTHNKQLGCRCTQKRD